MLAEHPAERRTVERLAVERCGVGRGVIHDHRETFARVHRSRPRVRPGRRRVVRSERLVIESADHLLGHAARRATFGR